ERIGEASMTRSRRIRSLVVCAAVAAAGCGGGRPFGHRAHTQAPSRPWPLPVLARAEVPLAPESASRVAPSVDARKIPAWSEVDRALGVVQSAPAGGYLLLSADDCARRCAETAPVVELLAYERAMADEVIARGHDSG